jgi:hypothetical protein
MKKFLHSHGASKGAALIIVLAFVVLVTALALAHFSRSTTDRQLAQSSYNDTSADLLARTALDIVVSDLKQEIVAHPTPTAAPPYYIQPARYPAGIPDDNPNLIRYTSRNAAASRASTVISTDPSANGRSISRARWNSHYLIPPLSPTGTDSTPVGSFTAPDWVLVTRNGPAVETGIGSGTTALNNPVSTNGNYVIGRYAFAVYDEGGLLDMNVGGFPNYASLTQPTRPTRRLAPKYPVEESEIMLAAFTPNVQCPKFNQSGQLPRTISTGAPFSFTPGTNHNGGTFSANFLPHGLSINTSTGEVSGIPTSPGIFDIALYVTAPGCAIETSTWRLTVNGFITPDSTPWPVNRARKGNLAFADLTTLPSMPTAITPTTSVGLMGDFLTTVPIDQLMSWRNYATTKQTGSFNNPSFPLGNADFYARNFLGAAYPLATSFTTVSTAVQNNRTDQAAMTRQELIKLQKTLDSPTGTFSQSLLQYLGTFSREKNRPAQDWPLKNGNRLSARFDMTYLQAVIPGFRIRPGNNGIGHAWGLQKKSEVCRLFGLAWVDGNHNLNRLTDPNYYGHWQYGGPGCNHDINSFPADPDFFQIINYATNEAIGVNDPNRIRNTFNIGASLIDMYDGDDLDDPDPNPPVNGLYGNTITIIDYDGNKFNYAYGIEAMSYDDPNFNFARPPFAPYPAPAPQNYVLLNRRFENVGEFGYAYNPASTLTSKTLDFASATSRDKAILDFFTYNEASPRAGIVNLNTRNGPVLASIISGAWLHDPGAEAQPDSDHPVVNRQTALAAGQAIVQETTSNGPALTRADVARLAAAAAAQMPVVPGASVDEVKQTIARALAEAGQTRTWNLMIDVIAQTGHYGPNAQNLTDFISEGEKRYWLHIALDREGGSVLGTQLEEVVE